MRKNPHDRILKWKSKEQHLSIVHKYCPWMKGLNSIGLVIKIFRRFGQTVQIQTRVIIIPD